MTEFDLGLLRHFLEVCFLHWLTRVEDCEDGRGGDELVDDDLLDDGPGGGARQRLVQELVPVEEEDGKGGGPEHGVPAHQREVIVLLLLSLTHTKNFIDFREV